MGWGFDFDLGSTLDSLWESGSDFVTDVAADVEMADVLMGATVVGGLYFQNEQLKQQQDALNKQFAADNPVNDLAVLSAANDFSATVDVGEVDVTTDEEAEAEEEERDSNVGKIDKDDSPPPKNNTNNKLTPIKLSKLTGLDPLKI